MFITAFTTAHHWPLSWANWIHSTPPNQSSQDTFWSHPPHLCLGLSSGLFPSGFPTKPCTLFSPIPCVPHALPHLPPWLYMLNDIWGWVQIMKLLTVQLLPFSCYFFLDPNILFRTLFSNTLSLDLACILFQLSNRNLNLRDTRMWHKWLCCMDFSLPNTRHPLYI
jgi:hypothetical protein